ncbi:MAG: hypothetical protein ACOCSE_05655 [Chitinivibrionales bacterium]
MWYATHNRDEVILEGIEIDPTLKIAETELELGGWGSVLTIWAIRDQHFTPDQAEEVSRLYFSHIDSLTRDFNRWHLTWAVSNIYRLGDTGVKAELDSAYSHACAYAEEMGGAADKHVNGERIYMGDYHLGGRSYARNHLVVPGNRKYLQSIKEYKNYNEM